MSWLTDNLTPEQADLLLDAWRSETVHRERLREMGICVHASSLSTAEWGVIYYPPQEYLEPGEALCLDCGKVWPSVEDLDLEVEALFG